MPIEKWNTCNEEKRHRYIDAQACSTSCWLEITPFCVFCRLGAHKRTSNVGTEQDFRVAKVITHPSYHNPKRYAHDIALLKLATPAQLNRSVWQVSLIALTYGVTGRVRKNNNWTAGCYVMRDHCPRWKRQKAWLENVVLWESEREAKTAGWYEMPPGQGVTFTSRCVSSFSLGSVQGVVSIIVATRFWVILALKTRMN